jgi:hypothetical protein
MAERLSDCRSGGSSHSNRRWRTAFLSTFRLGGDAEPRTLADSPSGPHPWADEMVERIDGQKRKPDSGPDRAALLAGRVLRSLPTPFESSRPHRRLYRGKSGQSRIGVLCGALAMVQRGLAGETACPTKPAISTALNVESSVATLRRKRPTKPGRVSWILIEIHNVPPHKQAINGHFLPIIPAGDHLC